jgi:hypothetical protein
LHKRVIERRARGQHLFFLIGLDWAGRENRIWPPPAGLMVPRQEMERLL